MSQIDDFLSGTEQPSAIESFLGPKPESGLARRAIGDTAVSLAKGVVGAGEGLAGLANLATGGMAGKALDAIGYRPKETHAILEELYSPEQRAARKAVSDAEGFGGTIAALAQNPSTLPQYVAEAIPSMVGGQAIAKGGLKAAGYVGENLTPAIARLAGATGEGLVTAGATAEQIRQQNPDGNIYAAVPAGILTGALGVAGGKIANKLGLGDIDTALLTNANRGTAGLTKRVLGGAASEGLLEELPQSMQEQAFQNLGTGRPLMEGVPEAGAQGAVVGGLMGGGFGVLSKPAQEQAKPTSGPAQDVPATPPATPPIPDPANGPLSAAAATSVLSGATQEIQARAAANLQAPESQSQQPPGSPESVPSAGEASISAASQPSILTQQDSSAFRQRPDVPPAGNFGAMNELADLINAERADAETRRRALPMSQEAARRTAAELTQKNGTPYTVVPHDLPGRFAVVPETTNAQEAQGTQPAQVAPEPVRADLENPLQQPTSGHVPTVQAANVQGDARAPAIDVTDRTDAQLNWLTEHGRPGWPEAAQAEIARRQAQPIKAADNSQGQGAQPAAKDREMSGWQPTTAQGGSNVRGGMTAGEGLAQTAASTEPGTIPQESGAPSPVTPQQTQPAPGQAAPTVPNRSQATTSAEGTERAAPQLSDIDAETMETRGNAPEVATPTPVKSVTVPARTLNGPKNVRAKLYELPGYKGPQLAVATYGKSGIRVYLPKSGALVADNNGVPSIDINETLNLAVLRVGNARETITKRQQEQNGQPGPSLAGTVPQGTPVDVPQAEPLARQDGAAQGQEGAAESANQTAGSYTGEQGRVKEGAAPAEKSAADWVMEMDRLRGIKPRPLNKMFGINPTPGQQAQHAELMRKWNAEYRKASKNQKEQLERDNAAFRAKREAIKEFLGEVQADSVRDFGGLLDEPVVKESLTVDAATATHQDPGHAPEQAAPAVVAEALAKGDANSRLTLKQMKDRLLGEIDAAIKTAPSVDDVFEGVRISDKPATYAGRKTWHVYGPKDSNGLAASIKIEQKKGAGFDIVFDGGKVSAPNLELAKEDAARIVKTGKWSASFGPAGKWAFDIDVLDQNEFVTFDVPGDGRFKVINTREKLAEFRAKVEDSTGFKQERRQSEPAQRRNASHAEIRRMVNEPAKDTGASIEDLANAIEIARANVIDDIPGLMDRFTEVAGMGYDAWRGEQEASDASTHQPTPSTPAKYSGPADVSSVAGQKEMANRGATIASMKAMNAQLRKIAPGEAWADENIEQAADLDTLRTQISEALAKAQRGPGREDVSLRNRLEQASGADLKAVFDEMSLAGGRLSHAERVEMLLQEDKADVAAALDKVLDHNTSTAEAPSQNAPESAPKLKYAKPSSIDTPAQGVLNQARERKKRTWENVKRLRDRIKGEPINGNREGLRLELLKAEQAHNAAQLAERDALRAIEKRANELGLTTVKPEGRASQADAPSNNTATVLRAELAKSPLARIVQALEKRGILQIHDDVSALLSRDGKRFANVRTRTAGYFDGKTLHLVAGNIKPGEAYAVFMHEGFHKLLHAMKFAGSKQYAQLMARLRNIEKLSQRGEAGEWFNRAREAIPKADQAREATRLNELAAYAVQAYEANPRSLPERIAKWVQDFIADVRAFLTDKLGMLPKRVSAADVAAMTRRYLKEVARGEEVGVVGEGANSESPLPKTITIDGVERPTTNSNGRPIHPTEDGIRNFYAWFGDSKVVDEQGRPMVVYHGTFADFDSFDDRRLGENTDDNASSQEYAETARVGFWFNSRPMGKSPERFGAGYPTDMPVYLRIENPNEEMNLDWLAQGLEGISGRDYRDNLVEDGYDGLSLPDEEFGGTSYVAFRPEQIKSAIGNSGDFSTDTADIRYSEAGALNNVARNVGNVMQDFLKSNRAFGPLRAIQTQLHKALTNAQFRPIWERINEMFQDSASAMSRPADLAPTILPKIEPTDMKDAIKTLVGKPDVSDADLKAVAKALSDGTLYGGPSPLKGKVFTTEELKQRGLTDKQIKLYQEGRAAVNASLTELAAGQAWRLARPYVDDYLRVMFRQDPSNATVLNDAMDSAIRRAKEELEEMRQEDPYDPAQHEKDIAAREKAIEAMADAANRIKAVFKQAEALRQAGYMPLQRFGQYRVAVTFKDDDGKRNEAVFRFESNFEANRARRKLAQEYPAADGYKVGEVEYMNPEKWKMFQGVDPDTAMLFAEAAGIPTGNAIQEWYKERVSTRSALKHMIRRTGVAGYSDDLPRILASFITSNGKATGQAYHQADIQRMVADDTLPGDVQQEAQKLFEYVQEPTDKGAQFRSFLAAWYLLGSPAAAMVNSTQTLLQTLPYLSQFGKQGFSPMGAARQLAKAYGTVFNGSKDEAMNAAVKRAEQEGVVDSNEVFHLYSEAMKPAIAKLTSGNMALRARALMALWGGPFAMVEKLNRKATFIAAYRMAQETGKADPFKFAEQAVMETQGLYAKHNRPNLARSPIGGAVLVFRQFSIAYLEMLARMWNNGPEGKKAATLAVGILFLMAGSSGLPFEDDLLDMIDTVMQGFFGKATLFRMEKRNFLNDALGKELGGFIESGVSNFLPIDLSGRFGMGNLLPGSAILKPSAPNKKGEMLQAAGVAGSFVESAFNGAQMAMQGNWSGVGKTFAPKAIADVTKGLEMAATGEARDRYGNKVVDTGAVDVASQIIGFNPTVKAEAGRKAWDVTEKVGYIKKLESNIVSKFARGLLDNDSDVIESAKQELAEWNARNPDWPIVIHPQQVRQRIGNLRSERSGRIIKMAPPELRRRVMEEIEE